MHKLKVPARYARSGTFQLHPYVEEEYAGYAGKEQPNEPIAKSLWFLASAPPNFINPTNMPPTTPPLVFNHLPGEEIEIKHKEAIRQLYGFGKVPIEALMT